MIPLTGDPELDREPKLVIMPPTKPDTEEDPVEWPGEFDFADWTGETPPPYRTYPPPKKNLIFRRKWKEFIDNVAGRYNFNIAHLSQLEILCDLYVSYESMTKFLRINGLTYETYGRQGRAVKPFPQVQQMNKTLSEIRNYSRILGLLLKKDESLAAGKRDDESWE